MLTEEEKEYFKYYYLIRSMFHGTMYEEFMDVFNQSDLDVIIEILYCINDVIQDNDSNFIVTKRTKELMQDMLAEILKLSHDSRLNEVVNTIKINLNSATVYSDKEYLIREYEKKCGKRISRLIIDKYEHIIREFIVVDSYCYSNLIRKDFEYQKDECINSYRNYIFSLYTILTDVEDILTDPVFANNVEKIINYNLSVDFKFCRENNIKYTDVIRMKRETMKVKKRMKA